MNKLSKQLRIRKNHAADSPEDAFQRQKRGKARVLIVGGLLLVAAVAAIHELALAQQRGATVGYPWVIGPKGASGAAKSAFTELAPQGHEVSREVQALSGKTAFGQFPPHTEAERELEKLLRGKDENIDLALVNWLMAADIPKFRDLTRESYFAQLDGMIAQVRQEMARMQKVAVSRGENLNDANTRCGIFCNAIIKLRFAYTEEFRQENLTAALMKALYADPNNICLAGLLRTRRGSCVSMPLIYLVIGQRLGVPIHLVAIGKHYFIRWEEPGYRMNIEPTIVERVSVSPDDSVYLEIEGVTREQLSGSDLRNLTSREVVGTLFFARSGYWAMKGKKHATEQRRDLTLARHLAPDDHGIKKSHEAVFGDFSSKPKPTSIKSNLKGNVP